MDTFEEFHPDVMADVVTGVMAEPSGSPANAGGRRRLTLGVCAVLVAGAGAGFAGGIASASGRPAASGVRIVVPESQSSSSTTSPLAGGGALSPVPCVMPAIKKSTAKGGSASTSCGCVLPRWGSTLGTATHVFTRTTGGGITIRVYGQSFAGAPGPLLPTPVTGSVGSPAVGSAGTPQSSAGASIAAPAYSWYSIDLSDAAAVGQGSLFAGSAVVGTGTGTGTGPATGAGEAFGATKAGATTAGSHLVSSITTGDFGVTEGAPAWWVAAVVNRSVAQVRVTFDGGATDSMAPVGGFVALAAPVSSAVAGSSPGPWAVRGTLQLLASSGRVLATVQLAPTVVPLLPVAVPGGSPAVGSASAGTSASAGSSSGSSSASTTTAIAPAQPSSTPTPTPVSAPPAACPVQGREAGGS